MEVEKFTLTLLPYTSINKRITKHEILRWQNLQKRNSSVGQECINYSYPKYQHRKPYSIVQIWKLGNNFNLLYVIVTMRSIKCLCCPVLSRSIPHIIVFLNKHNSEHVAPQVKKCSKASSYFKRVKNLFFFFSYILKYL